MIIYSLIFSEVKKVYEVVQKLNEAGIDSSRFSFDDLSVIGDDLDNKVEKISEVIQKLNEIGIDDSKFSFDNLSLIGDNLDTEGFLEKFKDTIDQIQEMTQSLSEGSEDEEGGILGNLTENIDIESLSQTLEGLEPQQQALILSTQGLTNAQIQQTLATGELGAMQVNQAMAEAGLLKSKIALTGAEAQQIAMQALSIEGITTEKLAQLGLVTAEGAALSGKVKLTGATFAQTAANIGLDEAQTAQLATMLGISLVEKEQIVSIIPAMIAKIKTLTKAIWAQVAATAKWLVTNPAGWAIMAVTAITAVAIAYDAYIKKIHEAAEEAKNSIDEIKSSYDNLSSSIGDIKDRYAELAQEVEELGKVNQNAGTLSTDEYEEFLDLSNQLSELFPQLTKGYDDNGNAILNLSGNVDTIVSSLNDLVNVEKELANQEILEKMPDLWKGYALDVKEYKKEQDKIKKYNDEILEVSKEINNNSSWYKTDDAKLNEAIKHSFEKSGITNTEDYYQRVYSDIWGYTGTKWD